MSQVFEDEIRQEENKPVKWRDGVKSGVGFLDWAVFAREYPSLTNQFREPYTDGDRVRTAKYDYRLRIHERWGKSVTRFEKDFNSNLSNNSNSSQPKQTSNLSPLKKSLLQKLRDIELSVNELTALVEGSELA